MASGLSSFGCGVIKLSSGTDVSGDDGIGGDNVIFSGVVVVSGKGGTAL